MPTVISLPAAKCRASRPLDHPYYIPGSDPFFSVLPRSHRWQLARPLQCRSPSVTPPSTPPTTPPSSPLSSARRGSGPGGGGGLSGGAGGVAVATVAAVGAGGTNGLAPLAAPLTLTVHGAQVRGGRCRVNRCYESACESAYESACESEKETP
eukprot:1179307-Prorocentrum_minimum.AAC.1